MRLMREVRCFAGAEADSPVLNSWAGTGTSADLGTFWTLRAVLEGPVDGRTGYLCDVKDVDRLLRQIVAPRLASVAPLSVSALAQAMLTLLPEAARACPKPARLAAIELKLSPHTALTAAVENTPMIQLTQSFEFAAAHRLSCAGLSDAENTRLFGKCSNPHGHGHNYVLEVTVASPVDDRTGRLLDLSQLDRAARERIIEPFDHKNLNVECPDFARLNPTVENIARVIFDRLKDAVAPARLARVRVWETPKTYAECSADDP
jgi:6-pyruvoyltetrahydropterin/6-carboxytetrahydropterin synthase